MKAKLVALLLVSATMAQAADFVPATEIRSAMSPTQVTSIRERVARAIKDRSAAGYHYASVDMDGASWKEEKQIKKDLETAGYDVDFGNDHHVYGWNAINGALIIRWVPRHEEKLFGDR